MDAVTPDDVRRLALALPGATESPHHDRASFRVGTKIFATLAPDEASVNVMVDEETARAAVEGRADLVELLWWGSRLSGVRIVLDGVPPGGEADVAELLAEAHAHRSARRP